MQRILIIRFSSIGDIVLTTPVIRCIAEQVDDVEIHYLTKPGYSSLLEAHPQICKIHVLSENWSEMIKTLKEQNFSFIVDLHNNLRSRRITSRLGVKSSAFNKLNVKKWLAVNFKWDVLPKVHIVQRYLDAAEKLGVKNDGKGLDHFIPENTANHLTELPEKFQQGYIALVIGAQHYTKKLPVTQLVDLSKKLTDNGHPVLLVGGPEDETIANLLMAQVEGLESICGKSSIQESALMIQQATHVITHDTGMMHIAAALDKKIISVWGNTIPEFGMSPYYGDKHPLNEQRKNNWIIENKGLSCRPCSKIGYTHCPKGHFKCMMDLDMSNLANQVNS